MTSKQLVSRRIVKRRKAEREARWIFATLKDDPEALALVCDVIKVLANRQRAKRAKAAA